MKIKHSKNCLFSSWYHLFENITINSQIINIPEEFVTYLLADGLVLPDEFLKQPAYDANSDEEEEEPTVNWEEAEKETPLVHAPSFPALNQQIKDTIDELGGKVFPKLNWSSPRDASWISYNNSTICSTVSDIYLLLKSSDFVMNDLTMPFKFCDDCNSEIAESNTIQPELILRSWVDIDPATEFRCFVFNNKIIGMCQRDCATYYKYMAEQQASITEDIQSFFMQEICGKFLDSDYVFDIYFKKKNCIRLIDFNPFGPITDGLLFEWDELEEAAQTVIENHHSPLFRCITCNSGVQPNPYRHYSLPRDIVDLTAGEDPSKLIDLLKLRTQTEVGDNSEDEDA